jgi:hypothetical protein
MLIQNHIVVFAKKRSCNGSFLFFVFSIIILPISTLLMSCKNWKGNIEARRPLIANRELKIKTFNIKVPVPVFWEGTKGGLQILDISEK